MILKRVFSVSHLVQFEKRTRECDESGVRLLCYNTATSLGVVVYLPAPRSIAVSLHGFSTLQPLSRGLLLYGLPGPFSLRLRLGWGYHSLPTGSFSSGRSLSLSLHMHVDADGARPRDQQTKNTNASGPEEIIQRESPVVSPPRLLHVPALPPPLSPTFRYIFFAE